jgi:predicted transcriptional regulator
MRLNAKLTRIMAMASMDEQILKATKEIVVKFIETGRLSPTAFPEVFQNIYQTVAATVAAASPPEPAEPEKTDPPKGKKR